MESYASTLQYFFIYPQYSVKLSGVTVKKAIANGLSYLHCNRDHNSPENNDDNNNNNGMAL
mgnify:CR=1 FL=1